LSRGASQSTLHLGQSQKRRNPGPLSIPRSNLKSMSTINHDPVKQQFTTEVEGHTGELDYTLSGNVMNITHTRVPSAIGGRGIAADLMRAALKAADERHWSVNPVCSYAVAHLKRHPDQHGHLDELLDEALDESFPASDSPSVGGSS
jgi:uncharacterized protein